MMLTPERLVELRNAGPDYYVSGGTLKLLLAHIEAQQSRIAELEAHLQLANDCQEPLFDELAEKANRIAELEQDAARYRAMRCATIAASYGLGHDPVEIEIKRAMKLSSLQGRRGELNSEEIDSAIDAAMQK